MKLLNIASNLDIYSWLRGLAGAAISGGASAVTSGFVVSGMDPTHYSLYSGKFYILVGSVFSASAVVSMAKFLQSQPLPVLKTVEVTHQTTTIGAKAPTVVETVKETTVTAQPPPPKENQ